MTFGPRATISPTVPRGTSLSFSSTMRTSTLMPGRPAEYILPLAACSAQWYSGPRVVITGAISVMP
ncbi:hypothetical protein D3C81_1613720 [compost metagenome]